MFAVASIAVIPLLGAAFDLSRAMGDRSKVQDAMDQAVFAGSQADPSVRGDVALRLFLANVSSVTTATVSTPTFSTNSSGQLTGTVTATVPTLFLSAASVPALTVTATSTASTVATSASSTTSSSTSSSGAMTSDKLRWAPPVLKNPITITVGDGNTSNNLDPTKDYIIKLPAKKKVGYTNLIGGHNVVVIGGYITLPVTSDLSNNAPSRAIYIKNATGTVHVEGILVDASGGGMSDAIDISAPAATVQIENVRVDGIYGYNDEFHADVVQPFGGVKDLRIDKLTGYTGYQGLSIGKDLAPIGSAEIYRANLVSTGAAIWGAHNDGGFLLWLTAGSSCSGVYPVTLSDVYLKPRSNLSNAVWPPVGTVTKCAAQTTTNDVEASFPKLAVSGYVLKGLPPQGDFVPAGVAGLNYHSPGYLG